MNLSIAQLAQTMRELPEYAKLQRIQEFRKALPMLAAEARLSSSRTKQAGYTAVETLVGCCIRHQMDNLFMELTDKTGIYAEGSLASFRPLFKVIGKTQLTKDGFENKLYISTPLAVFAGAIRPPNIVFLCSPYGQNFDKLKKAILEPETDEEKALSSQYGHECNHLLFSKAFWNVSSMVFSVAVLTGNIPFSKIFSELSEFHADLAQALHTSEILFKFQYSCVMKYGDEAHKSSALKVLSLLGMPSETLFHLDSTQVQDDLLYSFEKTR